MSKDEFRDVDIMFFVYLDWNALTIVMHANIPFLSIDFYFQKVHFPISLVVICCVDEDLVEYLVEGRDILDFLVGELEVVVAKYPFG